MSLVYAKNAGVLQSMGGSVNLDAIIKRVAPGGGGGSGVNTLNGLNSDITLFSQDGSVVIVPLDVEDGKTISITITPTDKVSSLSGLINDINLTSPDTSITITPTAAGAIELKITAALNFEGIQNKLGIFPTLPLTSDTIELAVDNDLTPPTAIVPDGTAPTSSNTPDGIACWLYTKPLTNDGFNWYMYNPRFPIGVWSGLIHYVIDDVVLRNTVFYRALLNNQNIPPPNNFNWIVISPTELPPLPYRKYSLNQAQDRLQSVWALVQPAVNTNIYTAGVVALNLYSFDDNHPPISGFYNTRWAYSNSQGQNSGGSGTNLFANTTYLLYAYDAPRTTNASQGQPEVQDWGLRDPYDIYTDVAHIPLQNCVIAFNPWYDSWLATINYITWTTTTAFLTNQTCVFSSSGLGGTGNGLIYRAVQNSTNQPPLSAIGVPNLTYWTALSPQPQQYASQPILSMALTGTSGAAAPGWGAGPLLRVLSMGYSTGNTPLIQTSGTRITLN